MKAKKRTKYQNFGPKFLGTILGLLLMAGCGKDDGPAPVEPSVTTTAVTDITFDSATSGGTITDDGGDEITASGVCFSTTNSSPTISDNTLASTTTMGSFTSQLDNLTSGSTYYVRAYATNGIGTGYGDVLTFSTGNAAPTATSVAVMGTPTVTQELTVSYTYSDNESDAEEGTTIQWYRADFTDGSNETAIVGATTDTYTLTEDDQDHYLRVGVTAMAATGTTIGEEVFSGYTDIIGGETITFMYMGEEVTYGIITSSETGRKWMDRNLGAESASADFRDFHAYGDLFQRGRPADGHQSITWNNWRNIEDGEKAGTPVNGTTEIIATSTNPGHSDMILATNATNPTYPHWSNLPYPELWTEPDYENNVCPTGWHVPTIDEWIAENLVTEDIISTETNRLKIVANGRRDDNTGEVLQQGFVFMYWANSVFYYEPWDYYFFYYTSATYNDTNPSDIIITNWSTSGSIGSNATKAVRCIKNE